MDTMKQFHTNALGGFRKKDVMGFIDGLSREHEKKCEALYDTIAQLKREKELLQAHLEQSNSRLKRAVVQLQNAKKELSHLEENDQKIIREKDASIEQINLQNRQLSHKNKVLEERIAKLNSLQLEKQNAFEWDEQAAREKTKSMIRQAKSMVETEYHQKMEEAEKESEVILKKAQESAGEMLKITAGQAKDVLKKTRQELAEMLDTAQENAELIVERANKAAKRILSDATEKVMRRVSSNSKPDLALAKERNRIRLDEMKQIINKEMGNALRYLDNATSSVKTAKSNVANIQPEENEPEKSKRTRRGFFD